MPFEYIPENLDFDVQYEQTKMDDKKYVINGNTGEYIGIVGNGFRCENHGAFFRRVMETTEDTLSPAEMQGAEISWRDAHQNGWAMMDMRLPNVTTKITTDKMEVDLVKRIIALHGVNGTCSNVAIFGSIDFFCLNGQIRGKHDKVMRKNTANFCLDRFAKELEKSQQDFTAHAEQMQRWANSSLVGVNVKDMLEKIMPSEDKAKKMYTLYGQEASVRGRNLYALYSAFTNYATYNDERNGFPLRRTRKDTNAVSMFKRELEVANWVEHPAFQSVAA